MGSWVKWHLNRMPEGLCTLMFVPLCLTAFESGTRLVRNSKADL